MTVDELLVEIQKHPSFVDWQIRYENMKDYSGYGPSAYVCLGLGVHWMVGATALEALTEAWLYSKADAEKWDTRIKNETGLEPGKEE
jgi:hypothetical protein